MPQCSASYAYISASDSKTSKLKFVGVSLNYTMIPCAKSVVKCVEKAVEKSVLQVVENSVVIGVENSIVIGVENSFAINVEKDVKNSFAIDVEKDVENSVAIDVEKGVKNSVVKCVEKGVEKSVLQDVENSVVKCVVKGVENSVVKDVKKSVVIKIAQLLHTTRLAFLLSIGCLMSNLAHAQLPEINLNMPGLQKTGPNHSIIMGGGLGVAAYREQITSPRIYRGLQAEMGGGYERQGQKSIITQDSWLGIGGFTDEAKDWNANFSGAFWIRSHLAYLFRLPLPNGRWSLHAGPASQFYSMLRLQPAHGNAAATHDFSLNGGLRTRIEYALPSRSGETKRWFIFRIRESHLRFIRLGWEVDLGLLGLQSRPAYTGVPNVGGNDAVAGVLDEWVKDLRIVGLGQFAYLNNQLYMRHPLRNGNCPRLGLNSMGYRYSLRDQPVAVWIQTLNMGYHLRLDNHKEIR